MKKNRYFQNFHFSGNFENQFKKINDKSFTRFLETAFLDYNISNSVWIILSSMPIFRLGISSFLVILIRFALLIYSGSADPSQCSTAIDPGLAKIESIISKMSFPWINNVLQWHFQPVKVVFGGIYTVYYNQI